MYTVKNHLVKLPKSGLEICIADEGQGEVILFVHGLSANLSCWIPVIERLKNSYRCIAIDLPGHGGSEKNLKRYSLPLLTDIVEEVIDVLRVDSLFLCGHSLGGEVAIRYTLRRPEMVSKLILAAPAGFERFTEKDKAAFLEFISKVPASELTDAQLYYICSLNYHDAQHPAVAEDVTYLKKLINETGQTEYFRMAYELMQAMLEAPIYDELPLLDLPVHVIYGEGDKLIPNKILHPLLSTKTVFTEGAARIQDSTLQAIPKAGHMVSKEKPAEFCDALMMFL
jgi:pimeloyl-ACP methyl ester carboxylesterase